MQTVVGKFSTQSPASVMFMGEYSILTGHPALVVAIDKYLCIDWEILPVTENFAYLTVTNDWTSHQTRWSVLADNPQLNFVMATLRIFSAHLNINLATIRHSANIKISSNINPNFGLGSSAAVCAAMLTGLNHMFAVHCSIEKLFAIGLEVIRSQQNGLGSGADLAASLRGGMVYFAQTQQCRLPQLRWSLPISLVYVGYKTKTVAAIQIVQSRWHNQQDELQILYQHMANLTQQAYKCLTRIMDDNQVNELAGLMSEYQICMQKLGVVDDKMCQCQQILVGDPTVKGVKVSGSGLGDCLLAIGEIKNATAMLQRVGFTIIDIEISNTGSIVV